MAKGLNKVQIGLEFSADTQQAKKQIQDLQQSLSKLTANVGKTDKSLGLSKEIQEAIGLTTQLQAHLIKATNVDTGKLDLGKFSDSLRKSGTNLKQYQTALAALGPQGNQAFSQLAIAIMGAEVPLRRINNALEETFVSLKNTARWQISSSVLHGFMGAVQRAYGYAQDLNESLNDIRIVTGNNVDEMADFAKEANKAAKALSTTTNEYSKASLIYFQQGLSDSQVKERTDITVKMANVSKQSSETVSDQMTAVWNNFYDGSKSLEYYADVMTKLGAATASSSDEIAQGLEKFAAIADTVGLSYDYAASALATVTAETRQSADVVGTSFKTIFARIEGLSLGDTLEDGTDLNKYSQALATVGVQIKDTNGEMKSMDTILEEMGSRWQTLGQDQKIALAQTVAGVRQYNQLIALMDNWGTFQENLATAQNSQGTLDKQARIYAESWEASKDRVTAAAEEIYNQLIKDDFFIDLNNSMAKGLDILSEFIDILGGVPGILTIIGSLVTKIFSKQIAASIDNMTYNIRMMGSSGRDSYEKLKTEANYLLQNSNKNQESTSGRIAAEAYAAQGSAQQLLLANSKKLTEEQTKQVQLLLDMQQQTAKKLIMDGEQLELLQKQTKVYENQARAMVDIAIMQETEQLNSEITDLENSKPTGNSRKSKNKRELIDKQITAKEGRKTELETANAEITQFQNTLRDTIDLYYKLSSFDLMNLEEIQQGAEEFEHLKTVLGDINLDELSLGTAGSAGMGTLLDLIDNPETASVSIETIQNAMEGLTKSSMGAKEKLENALKVVLKDGKKAEKVVEQLEASYTELGAAGAETADGLKRTRKSVDNVEGAIKKAVSTQKSFSQVLTSSVSWASNFGMALSTVNAAIDTLKDSEADVGQKLLSTFMAIGATIPAASGAIGVFKDLKGYYEGVLSPALKYLDFLKEEKIFRAASIVGNEKNSQQLKEQAANYILNMATKRGYIDESKKEAAMEAILLKLKDKNNKETAETIILEALNNATGKTGLSLKIANIQARLAEAKTQDGYHAKLATEIVLKTILGIQDTKQLVITLLLTAALIALVAVGVLIYKQLTSRIEATKVLAEESSKLAEEMKEQKEQTESLTESVKGLTDSYTQQLKSGQNVADLYKEITKSTEDLIASYKKLQVDDTTLQLIEQAKALGLASGNWDAYYQAIDKANQEAEKNIKAQAQTTVTSNLEAATDVLRKGEGWKTQNGKYRRWIHDKTDDEINTIVKARYQDIIEDDGQGDYTLKIDTTNVSNFLRDYNDMQDLMHELEAKGKTDTDLYKALKEEVEATSEYAAAMSESFEKAAMYVVELKIEERGIDTSQIQNLEDYVAVYTDLEKSFSKVEQMILGEDNVDSYIRKTLGTKGEFQEFEAQIVLIEQLMRKMGDITDETRGKIVTDLTKYFSGLSDQDKTLAYTVDLEYVESLDEFKRQLSAKKEFTVALGIKYNPEETLQTATAIREDLSDIMEKFSDQGYLTTTQAIEFINEYPQYKKYLVQTAEGYALSSEAVREFNGALEDQKEALEEILNPSVVGREALIAFGEELVKFETAFESSTVAKSIREITTQFINGEISSEDYFTNLDNSLGELVGSLEATKDRITAVTKFIPSIVKNLMDYAGAVDQAFENGQIGATEYRNSIRQIAQATLDAAKKARDATNKALADARNKNLEGVRLTQNEIKNLQDSANGLSKTIGELSETLTKLDAFEKINLAITADYEDLDTIFDEDFKIEIDSTELEEAIAKTKDFRQALQDAWQAISPDMQARVKKQIEDVGAQLGYTAENGKDKVVEAAKNMLNGTYVATADNTQLTAEAMGLIAQSGADTIMDAGTCVDNVIAEMKKLISNFKATISIEPKPIEWVDHPITIGDLEIPFKVPKFNLAIGGSLDSETQDSINTILDNLSLKNSLESGGSGGMSVFKPESAAGNSEDIQLDEESGSKDDTPDKVEQAEEVERYKEVNDELEELSHQLAMIDEQTDHLYGAEKVKAMKQRISLIDQEIKALERERKEAEAYLKLDRQKLQQAGQKAGLNFVFDEETGAITNYEEQMNIKYQELEAARATANSFTSKEKQEKYMETVYNPLLEEYEKLVEYGEKYDSTRETLNQNEELMQQKLYERLEEEIKIIEYEVEVQLEVDEKQFKQLERLLKRIEDRAFSAADAIVNLGLQASSTIDSIDVNKQGISDILKRNGFTDEEIEGFLKGDQAVADKVSGMNLSAEEIEALKTFVDGLTESVDVLVEIRKQVHDKILSAFEECNEAIDRGIEKLDYLKSVTESFANIIDLLGKANFKGSAELIKQLNVAQVAQSGDIAKANIAKRDMMATNLANARVTFEQQRHKLSEEEIKMWEDSIAEMESQLQDAELEAMSSIEAWMQAINDAFVAEIEATMERFSDTVAGEFKSLNQLQEAFDRRSDLADNYLEDYQKIYEFSKLNRDIENSIDHTDSIAGKKTLLELTEKITALEESGAKVSQYQVDSLRAQYELKMAQIALEEAQNAKTQVIRRRDEEGNYGYVYTADQEALGEAYQTYEDKLYAWQELNQTFIQETQEAMIGLQVEMEQKMMEIAQDESLSVDERKAKMAELYAYYEEQFNYYKEQLGVGFEDAQLIYNDDWTKYAESTGYKISADEDFIDSFEETQLSMLTGFETMEEYQKAFNQASEILLDESIDAFNTWQSNMENGPLAAMGTTFEDFAEDVGGYLDDIQQSSEDTREQIEGDAVLMTDTYQDVLDAIVVWEDQYSAFIARVVDESDKLINAFNTILTLWAQVNNIGKDEKESQSTQEETQEETQQTQEEKDKVLASRAAEIVKGVHYGTIKQTDKGWKPSAKAAGYTDEEIALALKVINDSKAGWSYSYNYKAAMKLLGYDTGGYTGQWGPEGRLALLHQKEIVLNAHDTENMLAMTQMVRDIAKQIDLTAVPTNRSIAPTAIASTNEGIEQNITIHAEFPDAVNQKEIEEAFNNLFMRVSQYANRKN